MFRYGSLCVWVPSLRSRLALRLGAHLVDVPCVAFGRLSCGRAFRCVAAPNLGEAILKSLPPSQNLFLSILQLVFYPSAPLCGCFHCGSVLPYVADVPWVALGHPICGRADMPYVVDMPCICVADVCWGAQLANVPCVVLAPSLRTGLVLRLGTHLADVTCIALGRPTLERPY